MPYTHLTTRMLFALLFLVFSLLTNTSNANELKPQLILLGVDGFSYQAMITAQKKGLFKNFQFGAHVAPFPSMSDVSWNSVMKTTEIFGEQGRLKSAEAVYFDESTKSLGGDVRDFYRRLANPKYYMGGFDIFFNPYTEGLMYFPTKEIPKLEITNVINEILESPEKPVITAFIAGPDSMAHTQQGKLYPILTLLDQELKRLEEGLRKKGLAPQILMISDHGNIGRFAEGSNEVELIKIPLAAAVKNYGFRFVGTLEKDEDVAVPMLALGSWAPVYMKNQSRRQELLKKFSQEAWFDLGVFIVKHDPSNITLRVIGKQTEAELTFNKVENRYTWKNISGKTLNIDSFTNLTEGQTTRLAVKSNYPDAFYRLVRSALSKDFNFPDILLTSKDGYCFDHSLSQFTKMYRTHGSLSEGSTLGLVASNFRHVPERLRSQNILEYFGIKAESLYQKTYMAHIAKPNETIELLKANVKTGVATNARDLSTKNIFRHITRFIADTRPFFLVDEINELVAAFKTLFGENHKPRHSLPKFDPSRFDFKTLLKPEDIGALTDAVLKNPDLPNFKNDPDVKSILRRVQKQTGYSVDTNTSNPYPEAGGNGVHSKRLAMKVFQIPPLLEKALSLQERTHLPETRDLQFAQSWTRSRSRLIGSPEKLAFASQNKTVVERLFNETLKEATLEDRIFPTPLPRIYNRQLKNLTIVYVPGIYNSIFDKEIFSLGLKKIEEDFGLRVLQAPTESTCSTKYNGEILMRFLNQDLIQRREKLGINTKYLVIGYSKGAVDSLAGFATYPDFVSKNIVALLSVAAPLHGSSILTRTDLPFDLVEALSSSKAPEACRKEAVAGKSVTPAAVASFWRQYGQSLIGLTRYLSVSFVSEMEESHLFMKATKLIAQFDEDNDGVVTISSSRFPESLGAVDLGKITADHLAGVLSSRFDQKSFFQALITTMAELGIDDEKENLKWNLHQMVRQANKKSNDGRISLTETNQGLTFYRTKNLILRSKLFSNVTNTYEANRLIFPPSIDPSASYIPKVKLPENQLRYDPYNTLVLKNMSDILGKAKVIPLSPKEFPSGINFDINHQNMVQFRMDHQFNYESTAPLGADDNDKNGYDIVNRNNNDPWLIMNSKGTSVRMTTMSYRFRPVDFPKFYTRLMVTKPVADAQVIKGGTGKDDSAFQAWFVLRVGNATKDRSLVDPSKDKTILFGYYWGTPTSGFEKQTGQIFENYYSNKNYVAVTLPEAKQILLEDPKKINQEVQVSRNFAADLQAAFPQLNVNDLEVIAITLQHDSNDTKSESGALLKTLKLLP